MYVLSNLCFLCFDTHNKITSELTLNEEILREKLIFCVPEIADSHSQIQTYICNNCSEKLEIFYKFKRICIRNSITLKNYVQSLTSTDTFGKPVRLTNLKCQNELSSNHTLPNIESGAALRTGGENDAPGTSTKEIFGNVTQRVDVIDVDELLSLYEEENDIDVKEESLTSDINLDENIYQEYVNRVKYESSHSVDSDGENMATNVEEQQEQTDTDSSLSVFERRTWKTTEKNAANELFMKYKNIDKLPSCKECEDFITANPCLQTRTPIQLKLWVQNQKTKLNRPADSQTRKSLKKRKWTSSEREDVLKAFSIHFSEETLPTIPECNEAKILHKSLKNRSAIHIKAYVNNEINKRRRLSQN